MWHLTVSKQHNTIHVNKTHTHTHRQKQPVWRSRMNGAPWGGQFSCQGLQDHARQTRHEWHEKFYNDDVNGKLKWQWERMCACYEYSLLPALKLSTLFWSLATARVTSFIACLPQVESLNAWNSCFSISDTVRVHLCRGSVCVRRCLVPGSD